MQFEDSHLFLQIVVIISIFYAIFPLQVQLLPLKPKCPVDIVTNCALQVITLLLDQRAKRSDQVLLVNTVTNQHRFAQDVCLFNFSFNFWNKISPSTSSHVS